MQFCRFLLLGIIISFLLFIPAWPAEFSADVVNKIKGQEVHSKIFMKPNKIRLEPQGKKSYSIMRLDKNVVWLVFPKDKVYLEMVPYEPQAWATKLKGEINRQLLGTEVINGFDTEKYEVTIKKEGKITKIWQWIATDLNYPIKIASPDGSWSSEYKNLIKEPQPNSLFELPLGFEKMEPPLFSPVPVPEKR